MLTLAASDHRTGKMVSVRFHRFQFGIRQAAVGRDQTQGGLPPSHTAIGVKLNDWRAGTAKSTSRSTRVVRNPRLAGRLLQHAKSPPPKQECGSDRLARRFRASLSIRRAIPFLSYSSSSEAVTVTFALNVWDMPFTAANRMTPPLAVGLTNPGTCNVAPRITSLLSVTL